MITQISEKRQLWRFYYFFYQISDIVYRYLCFDFILIKYAHYIPKPHLYLSVAFSFI